jgi:hypothetical protein
VPDALYVPDGPDLVPTELTAGPWSPDAQHGGPVSALLTRTVEQVPAPAPFQVLRVTVELLRPVPLRPLQVRAEVTRPGRNVQLIEATLEADGVEVARARALRLRVADVEVPSHDHGPPPPALPAADAGPAGDPVVAGSGPPGHAQRTAFFAAVDLRFVAGSWDTVGPATIWGRLLVPVVAGEETSRLAQAVAIADFGNGISRVVPFETHRFINPDLTVALARPPEGEWIGFDVVTRLSAHGSGQAESLVFDRTGPVGRAVQTLLVDQHAPRAEPAS